MNKHAGSCGLIFMLVLLLGGCSRPAKHPVRKREALAVVEQQCLLSRIEGRPTLNITLEDAIQYALDANLELAVKALECKLQNNAIAREMILQLPSLRVSGSASWRSEPTSAFSESLEPAIPPAPPSIASEQTSRTWNANATWNLLSFGVHFLRARQERDQKIIKQLEYDKVRQDIIKDTVENFWSVAAMADAIAVTDKVTALADELLEELKDLVDRDIFAKAEVASEMARILWLQKEAKKYRPRYYLALERLKALMGIPAQVEITLQAGSTKTYLPQLPLPYALQQLALVNRPELYVRDAEERIIARDSYLALLRMFPEISPFIEQSYDSNRYLLHNYWTTSGVRALWDLLGIPLGMVDLKTSKDNLSLNRAERLALTLGVISQVHLSASLYYDALDRYISSRDLREAKAISFDLAAAKKQLEALGEINYVHALADLALAMMEEAVNYSIMRAQLEQLNHSIGIPLYFSENASWVETEGI